MTLDVKVPDMACSVCADKITKAVQALDPSATIQADTKTKQVKIDTQAPEVAVREAITTAGYTIAS
ncbi:MAG: heavy-metal-associated domain-containing protein [Leptolyngbyaceae cyanobacterium bins.59]|nr:heavy-metal-associated domain-containing protein [Leptolyngbyaceae cyanobacterium bins.59]